MNEEIAKIYIVAQSEDIQETESESGRRTSDDIGGSWGSKVTETIAQVGKRKRVPIDAIALKAQMDGLLTIVGDVFSHADQQTNMTLHEVELSVEINAEGQVSLVGNGGKLGNTGGITLKFVRPIS